MGAPFKGTLNWKKQKIDELAIELRDWMVKNEDEWQIEKFSTSKLIPYHYFTGEFPEKSSLFREIMYLCEDLKRIRFVQQVKDKQIPPTFAIFASKNELDYRDRIPSEDKKSNKKEQPTKQAVKDAIAKAKENSFSKPD
jgi:hypothetical protein